MSPSPGTRLGSYEVTAKIGSGGMGEVYRVTSQTSARKVEILRLEPDNRLNLTDLRGNQWRRGYMFSLR